MSLLSILFFVVAVVVLRKLWVVAIKGLKTLVVPGAKRADDEALADSEAINPTAQNDGTVIYVYVNEIHHNHQHPSYRAEPRQPILIEHNQVH